MRTHTLMRALAAALLSTSALALAACGADENGGGADSADKRRDAALAYAQCMRDHGIDMPDPSPDGGIRLSAGKGTSPRKVEEANRACKKHLDAAAPAPMDEAQKKEFQEAALAHARCMREHGIDFPDPTFDDKGRATIRIDKGQGTGKGPMPEDREFREADEACRKELPNGGKGAGTTKSIEP